ncbi:DNA/RNA polymerase [Calocera viscosa TUFC12733]|uniref:DNA-directed RNA polymerase n=1 Tax=Calocera viscosa (strain TUFC12733) TaxID=1330018 RepID=A0A167NF74_CALVF|nr:DNA/RNA polymerase [Calocera viscosa TUFC12733]
MLSSRLSAAPAERMCRHIGGRRYSPRAFRGSHGSTRGYATSSKPANASVAYAVQTSNDYSAPPFPLSSSPKPPPSIYPALSSSLPSRIPLTLLPTPLPVGESSPLNTHFFPDSSVQHTFSVMDALLRDGYDVPRAARMFDSLRRSPEARSTLDVDLYNSFLGAYLTEALKETTRGHDRSAWLNSLWQLFGDLTSRASKWIVRPNRESFAIALLALVKFSDTSDTPVINVTEPTKEAFLRVLLEQHVMLSDLMKAPLLQYDIEACSRLLRVAALDSGRADIAMELGKAVFSAAPDQLEGIPEVLAVTAPKFPVLTRILRVRGKRIRQVPSPSEGDQTPFNLQSMRDYLEQVRLGRASLHDDPTARQRLMEESAYQVAAQRWRHEAEGLAKLSIPGGSMQKTRLKNWMWEWYQTMIERLDNEIPTLEEQESVKSSVHTSLGTYLHGGIAPYLRLLATDKMATMTITELLRYSCGMEGGVRTTRAAVSLGRAIEIEHDAEVNMASRANEPNAVLTSSEGGLTELAAIRRAARETTDLSEHVPEWTQAIRARVGSFLLDALMDVATVSRTGRRPSTGEDVSEEQPAFAHTYEFLHGRKIGMIKLNDELAAQLSSEPIRDALHPRQLPMLIPPRPWIDVEKGGYMYSKSRAFISAAPVMRFKDSLEQSSFLRSASSAGHLESMFAALDVLGSTPWTINRPIFDVVLTVWNTGEAFPKLPPVGLDLEDPPKPADYEVNPTARRDYVRVMSQNIQKRLENHSIRCDVNYKMEIARAFLGERFYFPHNVDFRGRAYPVPPNLNHMGDDLCRGLLTFADKKALGERGFRWLKIHVANKFGYDKASLEERVNWTMEHLDDIYDSATKPLEGRRWWLGADDPWQCLAACIELHNALESPNPLEFESSLPVHQDGTCNGLQHYAALGGDGQGAQQVNLDVGDRPADVYTFVADMVEKRLEEAAEKGHPLAERLKGRIARKVVKQTVMTTVYGVTFVGARDQIRRQLDAIPGLTQTENESYSLAVYVAKITLACIGDLFGGARSIQGWLTQVAGLISKSIPPERIDMLLNVAEKSPGSEPDKHEGRVKRSMSALVREQMTSMIWTTPLGMPVVQPYRKQVKKQIFTALQTIFIADPNLPSEVSPRKQASAFPPNFIHSLDATHMMLTALGCRDKQLTFASVHDSYWTHAASIDEMSETIRDTFVRLHSADILGNLLLEIEQRYKDYKIPVSSVKGQKPHNFRRSIRRKLGHPPPADAEPAAAADDTSEQLWAAATGLLRFTHQDYEKLSAQSEIAVEMNSTPKMGDADADEHVDEDADARADEDGDEKPRARAKRLKGKEIVMTRFINLTEILPPLPPKGAFDIQKIKDSLYFFS